MNRFIKTVRCSNNIFSPILQTHIPNIHNWYTIRTIHTESQTQIINKSNSKLYSNPIFFLTLLFGCGSIYILTRRDKQHTTLSTTNLFTHQTFNPTELIGQSKISKQERNFADNATYIYQGVLYMSPANLLRLLTRVPSEWAPKNTHSITKTENAEVNKWLETTSSKKKSSHEGFLKENWNAGILSYPDYRFLLSTLVKYKHHFKIAFSIYDRDCNGSIELSEFIRVQNSMLGNVPELLDPRLTGLKSSLLVHLFGYDGKGTLSFEEFSRFIDAFQKEILLYEFNDYAKGNSSVSSDDFANLIMRYSSVSKKEIKARLYYNLGDNTNTLPEFDLSQYEKFCNLALNIEDLATVLGIYTVSGKGVSKREFNHAVEICCGEKFDDNLIDIIYSIFNKNKMDVLNYKEFLCVLSRRQKRGTFVGGTNRERFSTCFKSKVREQNRDIM